MNKVLAMFMFVLLIIVLTACNSGDPIEEDLTSYANDHLIGFHTDMDEISALYASVRGDNYTDDLTMYNMIHDEILPRQEALLDKLEGVIPETTEVNDIHLLLTEANIVQFNSYLLVLEALDAEDPSMVDEANDLFSVAQQYADQFDLEIQQLALKHNLEFN